MAWTATTGSGSLASGYQSNGAAGVTSIRWGTKGVLTAIGAVTSGIGVTVGVVTRIHQRSLVDNIKLPNGDGLTITRVQILDGYQWDVTIRDDTGITARPSVGTNVTIADGGGLIDSTTYKLYTAVVVESAWESAPKQPGEITLSVERLTLVDTGAGA